MKPEDKLPKTFDWRLPDGTIKTVTREDLIEGFKVGATGIRELMRDKGTK